MALQVEGPVTRRQLDAVLDTPKFKRFLYSLKSRSTVEIYSKAIGCFAIHRKLSIVDDLLTFGTQEAEDAIIDYLIYLKEDRKIAWNSRQLYGLTSLKKYYDMNRMTLNWKLIRSYLGEKVKVVKDRAYTTEDTKKLLEKADERKKAIILILASSGMRIGALSPLKFRHLHPIELPDSNQKIYRITCYEKTNDEYFTYCTPEAATVIDSYLSYRKRYGEKIMPDSPVIRDQFDKKDPFDAMKGIHVTDRHLAQMLSFLAADAGLIELKRLTTDDKSRGGRERKEIMRAHGFRKFFNTACIRAGLKSVHKEMLLGHRTGLDENYYRPEEQELLQDYMKAIPLLTINDVEREKVKTAKLEDMLEHKLADLQKQFASYVKTGRANIDLNTAFEITNELPY